MRLEMFRYIGHARRSIVADCAAHRFLVDRIAPKRWIPAAGGWVISYEAIAGMVDHLLARAAPSNVVELGSGVSTIWLGLALRDYGSGHLTAFEHDPVYAARTRAQLRAHDLDGWCTVLDSPLAGADDRWPEGWYHIDTWHPRPIDLLLVDGPPGAGREMARDPAFDVLGPYLAPGALLVVDDVDREDEARMVNRWLAASQGRLSEVADHGVSRFLVYDETVPVTDELVE